MRLLNLFSLALISTALHAGGVYKWTDANGQIHFTDKPPIGKQAQLKDVKPASGDAPAGGASGLRPGEIDRLNQANMNNRLDQSERARAREEASQRMAADDRAKQRACDSARKQESYYTDKLRTGCGGGSCDYYKERREEYRHKAHDACK